MQNIGMILLGVFIHAVIIGGFLFLQRKRGDENTIKPTHLTLDDFNKADEITVSCALEVSEKKQEPSVLSENQNQQLATK